MTPELILLAIALGIALVLAAITIADRTALANAWRTIAEERRWNRNQHSDARQRPPRAEL